MKWLFFRPNPSPTGHKTVYLQPYNIKIGKFMPDDYMIDKYEKHILAVKGNVPLENGKEFLRKKGKDNMQYFGWIPALDADYSRMWKNFDPDDYDAFMVWLLNIDIGRASYLRRIAGDKPIIGLWEAWMTTKRNFNDPRRPLHMQDIEACDVIIQDRKYVSGPELQNWYFNTDKFEHCQNPMDTEGMTAFTKERNIRFRDRQVFSSWYKGYEGGKHNVEIFKKFLKEHKGWTGHMSWGKRMQYPTEPFKPLPDLVWNDFLEFISESYVGIGSTNGGPATIHAFAACMGIPSVGSTITESIMNCFPHLARKYYDYEGQAELLSRLVTDESFYKDSVKIGEKNIKSIYSFKGALKNLINILKKREII